MIRIVLALIFSAFSAPDFDSGAYDRMPASEINSEIQRLQHSLKDTKGPKRGKIIKQIAELENKLLEKKRSESTPASQR